MSHIRIAFVLFLLNVAIEQHGIQAAQSLDDFFPFGLKVGDTIMAKNDDGSYGPIRLPYIFPYFDNNHRQIYQANNGLFSFPIGDNQRLITPFWSDIDTRGSTGNSADNSVYHHVYTRTTGNATNVTTTVFDKATLLVRRFFPRESTFSPVMVITGTWYRVGYYSSRVDRLNTFQMVLVTDESRSFAFFLYHDLQWASRDTDGRNVNAPGLFAFHVDTTDIEAGGCTDQGPLQQFPLYGSQIGGTTVNLQGRCFNPNETEILCRFGPFGTVPGLILSEFRATCVLPLAAYPGNVDLSISFDGGDNFTSSGVFTYMRMSDDIWTSEQIVLRTNGTVAQAVSWSDISSNLNGLFRNHNWTE